LRLHFQHRIEINESNAFFRILQNMTSKNSWRIAR
jgi:hypothetical protein